MERFYRCTSLPINRNYRFKTSLRQLMIEYGMVELADYVILEILSIVIGASDEISPPISKGSSNFDTFYHVRRGQDIPHLINGRIYTVAVGFFPCYDCETGESYLIRYL